MAASIVSEWLPDARRRNEDQRHATVGLAMPDEAVPPILCAHLLHRVDGKLIDLLSSHSSAEWDLQTIVPLWKVRDVAAHLLDTVLRKLSMVRDLCYVETVHHNSATRHDRACKSSKPRG